MSLLRALNVSLWRHLWLLHCIVVTINPNLNKRAVVPKYSKIGASWYDIYLSMKTYQRDVLVINILLHITFLSVGINVKKRSSFKTTSKNKKNQLQKTLFNTCIHLEDIF